MYSVLRMRVQTSRRPPGPPPPITSAALLLQRSTSRATHHFLFRERELERRSGQAGELIKIGGFFYYYARLLTHSNQSPSITTQSEIIPKIPDKQSEQSVIILTLISTCASGTYHGVRTATAAATVRSTRITAKAHHSLCAPHRISGHCCTFIPRREGGQKMLHFS